MRRPLMLVAIPAKADSRGEIQWPVRRSQSRYRVSISPRPRVPIFSKSHNQTFRDAFLVRPFVQLRNGSKMDLRRDFLRQAAIAAGVTRYQNPVRSPTGHHLNGQSNGAPDIPAPVPPLRK